MRAALILALALLLAGCAGSPQPVGRTAQPSQAILYRDGVNVLMSDRSLCVGERPGKAPSWAGVLDGCPHPLAYQASTAGRHLPPRVVMQAVADRGDNPYVLVTGPSGKSTLFSVP